MVKHPKSLKIKSLIWDFPPRFLVAPQRCGLPRADTWWFNTCHSTAGLSHFISFNEDVTSPNKNSEMIDITFRQQNRGPTRFTFGTSAPPFGIFLVVCFGLQKLHPPPFKPSQCGRAICFEFPSLAQKLSASSTNVPTHLDPWEWYWDVHGSDRNDR